MPIYEDNEGKIFESSPAKNYIKSNIDKPIIQSLLHERMNNGRSDNEKLRYFGLPGPYMLDIEEWDNEIGYATCIEKFTNCKDIMVETAFLRNRLRATYIKIGEIEDVLKSMDELTPPFPNSYDIAYLDFYGPGIYLDGKGNSPRIEAIKSFVEHQDNKHEEINDSFLLFLTVNLRTNDGRSNNSNSPDHIEQGQVEHILDGIKKSQVSLTYLIDEIKLRPEHFKLKIAIPRLIQDRCNCRFRVFCYPAYYYIGNGSVPMLHFRFKYEYTGHLYPIHDQSIEELCKLPLLQIISSNEEITETTLFP